LDQFPAIFWTPEHEFHAWLRAVSNFMLATMSSIGGPELVLILAALVVIGLGMAGVAFAVYVIVRAAGKSRPIPMAPPEKNPEVESVLRSAKDTDKSA
jgi:hypothetical protein